VLGELLEGDAASRELLAALADDLPLAAPSPELRSRLLASIAEAGAGAPREAAVEVIARWIDRPRRHVRALLDGLAAALWEPVMPGVETLWVDGGPAAQGCIRGFVRLRAGTRYPHHRHLGEERVIVLRGGLTLDDGRALGPGDVALAGAGTSHSLVVDHDTLLFVVVREGLAFRGGRVVRHRDQEPVADT